ncbi:MAG: hypothetical protein FGM41_06630, partial [Bacteroidetes bacterium]|nr:hypothetical protein [Bacteroidota bacterium]
MKKIAKFLILCLVFVSQVKAQAVLPASWNFSNPSIANPPAGFTLNILLGTDTRTTYSPGVGDNIAARLDFTGEFI